MRNHTSLGLALALVLALTFAPAAVGFSALAAQAVLPEAMVLSPEPGERVAPDAVLVAVSFIDPADRLDAASVTVQVSGRDVTAEAELRGGILTWRPRQPLPSGPQRVVVTARDRSGAALAPSTWTFSVMTAAEAPAPGVAAATGGTSWTRLQGSVIVEGLSQSVSGLGAPLRRQEDFLPRMWLNAGGLIRPGWRYATRVHVSGYESADQQPVNRFRLDLRAPFMNVSAGDVNPVLQDLILSGRRVRGLQGELWAGPARVSVITGESRRAIPGMLDPTNTATVVRQGTFGQRLIAVRPAIGSGQRFQFGLTMLSVRDDVSSIDSLNTRPGPGEGSSRSANPTPKDNLVAGADLTLRFGRHVLFRYENGWSLLANDISAGALTEAGLDSIMDAAGRSRVGIDPSRYERYFIVNASMIPLDPRGRTNLAQQARASVRAGSHLLSAEWRSVGGSYYTLGYSALQRDRRGIRLRDTFWAANDALVMSLGIERDQDNLDGVKATTTTSSGGFVNANWQPSPQGVMLSGTVRMGTRSNDLRPGEDGALDESNRTLSAGVSVPVSVVESLRTRVSLNASMIERDDPANPHAGSRDLYFLGGLHGETQSRESTGALLFGVNRSELTGFSNAETDLFRLVATGRQALTPRWSTLVDASFTGARSPEEAGEMGVDYNRVELLGGGEFEWMPSAIIAFTAGLVSYTDNRFAGRDTRELIARLRLSRTF